MAGVGYAAHAAGAIVVLSTTRFGGSALAELLGSVVARNNAINSLVNAMVDGGGDGIDVDFEGLDLAKEMGNGEAVMFLTEWSKWRELVATNPGPDTKDDSGSTLLHYVSKLGLEK